MKLGKLYQRYKDANSVRQTDVKDLSSSREAIRRTIKDLGGIKLNKEEKTTIEGSEKLKGALEVTIKNRIRKKATKIVYATRGAVALVILLISLPAGYYGYQSVFGEDENGDGSQTEVDSLPTTDFQEKAEPDEQPTDSLDASPSQPQEVSEDSETLDDKTGIGSRSERSRSTTTYDASQLPKQREVKTWRSFRLGGESYRYRVSDNGVVEVTLYGEKVEATASLSPTSIMITHIGGEELAPGVLLPRK